MPWAKPPTIRRLTDSHPHLVGNFQGFRSAESKVWHDAYFRRCLVLKECSVILLTYPDYIQDAYFTIQGQLNNPII